MVRFDHLKRLLKSPKDIELKEAIVRGVVTMHRLLLVMKNERKQKIGKQQLSATNYPIIADSWNHNLKASPKIVDNQLIQLIQIL